ncbi:hypothetical protein BLNAU_8931 [Blattamonas nauphoetae]|uniref:Protein kinase domain-containing protein n=1 Tax=Blattamonas nauphoetae TaxID=2049346 RepID=A0ABQ9XXF2_9EUKA|nr:hypothetical protein BLNAU_8931 [Blattamonas nauphoetae]
MLFLLTWAWTLTQTLHDLQIPDLGETILSHSRVSNHEESPQTILLQYPRYQSRTVEISSEVIAINGTAHSRPTILESQQVKGTLLHMTNSTASFANLAFQSPTARILTAIDHSECLVANSVISVIEDVSPIECSDSLVRVVNSEFDFTSTQNRSPSLSTTSSLSSSVLFHSCSFSDVVVTSPGSLISCSCVQTSETDRCDFRNISHCSTFLQSSFSPPFHNVSVLNSRFWDCENVLFGGVVRDTEDRTSLLAANTTFTRSRSTYTNITGESFGPIDETAAVVTVDHRYQQCTFTQCVSADLGGGIRCNSGANLAVDTCTFIKCRTAKNGGAIYVTAKEGLGGASITRCSFGESQARFGGGLRIVQPSHLVVQFCNISACEAFNPDTFESVLWGGGIAFEGCTATQSGSALDNNQGTGSITYSNLLFAHNLCPQGTVIFSTLAGTPEIGFFSCTFFSNVATLEKVTMVNGTELLKRCGNDILFQYNEYWPIVLKKRDTFVNCFSKSDSPRIILLSTKNWIDFSYGEAGNGTLLDIHLPTPGVVVSAEKGKDEPGCGSPESETKCLSIGFTGVFRLADADTSVLVEGGRYEETISFNVGSKPAFFSSNGDVNPIVSFTPQSGEDRFMELGVGTLSLSLFTFVPCATASIVKVVGAGTLMIELCQFQNEDGLSPIVETSIITMSEGTALLKKVAFVGISFNQGWIVRCSGDVTKLEIQESLFTGLSGTAGPLISFERSSEGGEFIVHNSKLHGSDVSDSIGGITTNNVKSVSITSTTFAHLTDGTQQAALSIRSCTTALTLSDLLYEDCSGSEASSLFVASSVTLTSPIPNSLSTTDAPISSVNGDTTTAFLLQPNPIVINPTDGLDTFFCWKESTGCVSLSSLTHHLGKGINVAIAAAAGTFLESSVSLDDRTLLVSGNGKISTTFQHSGGIDSPLFVQTSGSLTVSGVHFSVLPALETTTRSASFFVITGGSISLTSVSFSPMSFSSSNSLIRLTGASSITLSTINFSGMATEGSGSVLHSTSTGTIALSSVSFSSCNCGASQKGRSVFIERSFVADCVSMTSVQVSSAGTVGSHDIFLKGSNVASTVTESWESLIGAENTLTPVVMGRVVGEEDNSVVKSGPLAYVRYPHTDGSMHVDGHYWDHENCGKEKLPCKSFGNVHSKLNTSNQKVVFLSAYTLTGEINSLTLGSVLTTKQTQTVSTDPTTQFVVQAGPLSFEAIHILLPTSITKSLFVVKASVLSIASSVTIQNAPSASTHQAPLFSLSSGSLQMTGTQLIFQPIFVSTKSLIEQTSGNLELNSVAIENVSKSTGDGSVLHSTLSSTSDKLLIESTAFKLCSCSAGNGGALFVSLSASALFSIAGTSSFTSCTASGKGSKLYLTRPSLISFLSSTEGTGPLNVVKPALTTKAATDGILNEFYGFESPSSEGSLLFYWYPFSSDDTTMHVHSSGHAHSLCGKEALPCQTLPDSLSKIQSATTLMIDTSIELSSKIVSLDRTWTLTKTGSAVLTLTEAGQLEMSNSGSVLTFSSLSLEVGTLTVDRTTELITVSAGSLVVSSCTIFASTPSLSVSFVSLSNGEVSVPDSTMNLPTLTSNPFLSVSGGTLNVNSSASFVNSGTAIHQASLVSVSGGTVDLDGAKLTTTKKLTLALSPLIVQTKGSLTISSMKFENISRTTGDGSVISATLAANADELSIVSTTFTSCSCSAGNGGALAVILSTSALFSITGTSTFTSCTASGKGSKLCLSRPSLVSFLTPNEGTGPLDSIKPTLSTKAAADFILNEFYGSESSSSEGSLLFYWYPFSTDDVTMHVHSTGHAHSLCGTEALPCQTLPDSLSKIQSASTVMIDTNIELSSKLTSLASEWTLSSSGSFMVTLSSEGQIEVKDDQSNLTMSSLSLDVGTLSSERNTELVSVSAGFLVLSSCTVFSSTSNLPVSFVALSGGVVSMTSTTLNIPTIRSQPVLSVTGGKLEVDSSTSFVNSDTVTHEASLVSIGGGEVVLDGASLTTSHAMTFASSALIVQTKGSLTMSSMKIENITRQTGDGSVLHSTLSSTSDKVQISGPSSFKDCHSTVGNGGALFISCPQSFPSSSLVVDASFSDCSCGPAMKGEWVFVEGHTFKDLLKPESWTKTIAGLTWDSPNSLWGTDTSEAESSIYRSISLLYHLVPYRQQTIHVGTGGRNENGCGSSTWKCQTLNQARDHLSGSAPFTLSIDTEASHSDGPAISSATTIKGNPATSKLLVGATGSLSVSASTLSLSTLVLDGSSVSRQSSLLALSQTGSIDINHCTFTGFKSTADGAVFSSALGAGNSVTIANTAFTSCSSDGNGGALAITLNGGSLTLTDTNVTFSSCAGLNGKNVYLAGQDLVTTLATGGLNGIKPSTPENGVDHPLCGVQALPCLKLSHALTNTNSAAKFLLDSQHSLNEDVTITNTATITSNTAGLAVDVQSNGCFSITANTLSVKSLTFTTTVLSFDRSLFTITNTGSLALSGSSFTGFSSTVAGSVVSGTVSTSVLIEQCTLSQCNSTEIGGIFSVSLTGSGTISISDNTFGSCTSSQSKGNLGSISSSDLIAFLKTNPLSSIKPSIPENGIFGNEEKSKWFGMDTATGTTGSLLYYWYPHLDTETSTHVHSNGETHKLCGLTVLPCSALSSALQKTTAEKRTIIDFNFLLNESISAVFGAHTLTSASPLNTVTIGTEAAFALTANSLTLQSISFTQSTQVQALARPLISVTSAPITIDHCTFSKFNLADSALIAHTGSILSLSGGTFKGITRRQGEGAVLASTFTDGMELHVDGVTLDTLASETGLADGIHISFLTLSNPTHSTPFSLKNMIFTQSSASNADSSHYVTIVGNNFSTWIVTGDPRFAGSYESLPSDSWMWSVDEETELNGSVVFYLKEGTGPVGVSDAGYLISKCGFFSVWCGKLEYGLTIADAKHQVQLNIHDTVTVDTLIDMNEEYRIHGKLSSSVIVLTQMGGFVIDSGEEVIFDGMTLKVAGNADRSTLEVLDGHFVVKNARILTNTASSLPFIHCQDSQLTFESVVLDETITTTNQDTPTTEQALISIKESTASITSLSLAASITSIGRLVSVEKGTFSLVNFELHNIAITSTPFVFSEVASCTLTNLTASELPSTELIQIDDSDSFTLQSCSFRGESDASSHLNEDTLCSWSTGLININSTPTTIRGSEFTSLRQGALTVNGSRVSVATSEFMINSAGSSDFPSAHRNIRCKDGNVTFVDLSGGDGVNNTSLWISGENCEVRVKEEKIISPFFQPTFDAEKSSSKQEKNKTLTVTLVAGLLIPCGLQIEVYESSKESDHTASFRKTLTPSTVTSFTEQKVVLSLSPTEVASKLNANAEWKGRIVTGNEQRSSSFLVKQSLSDERKSLAMQAMKWVIPVVCAVLALLFILIILIVICRRRRQKKATEKKDKEELNDVQDEKIEVLNDDLLYPATSLVNAVPSHAPLDKEADTEPKLTQQAHPSLHPDPRSFTSVEVVKAEQGVQVAQINKRDTLYNRLHSNQRQPISKGMTAQQIVRALMKLYNVNSALDLFTRFSSHVVLFDKEGQVYLDMNASNPGQSAVPLVPGQPIAQAQPATDSNLTQTSPVIQREGFEMMRWRAPETIVERGEEKKEVKPDQAAVFSLGLVLYEIETGLVPFGEMDAVNASRQLRTGCLPKMELVGSDELSTLIAECLSLDGKFRPKLDSLESRIASISFKMDDTPNLLEFS